MGRAVGGMSIHDGQLRRWNHDGRLFLVLSFDGLDDHVLIRQLEADVRSEVRDGWCQTRTVIDCSREVQDADQRW